MSSKPNSGLGQPLVTVSKLQGGGIRPVSDAGIAAPSLPVGNDHPLATPHPPQGPTGFPADGETSSDVPVITKTREPEHPKVNSPTLPDPSVAGSQVALGSNTIPATSNVSSTAAPVSANNVASPPVSTSPQMGLMAPARQTLDVLADSFMSAPSYRTLTLTLPPILKPLPLPQNQGGVERLRTLIERRAWGDVLQVSGDMLRNASSPHAGIYATLIVDEQNLPGTSSTDQSEIVSTLQKETAEIMTLECHAWLKLRCYTDLGRELQRWSFLHPTSHQESFSWVPWSLHILAAEALQYTDSSSSRQCLDELCALKKFLALHDSGEKENLSYQLAVDAAQSNIFQRLKDWRMALESLERMLKNLPSIYSGEILSAFEVEVLSRQGRILLQVGAIDEAGEIFERIEDIAAKIECDQDDWMIQKIPIHVSIHGGLINFARKSYEDSMAHFQQASDLLRQLPNPIHAYHIDSYVGAAVWRDSPQTLLTQIWNNMSLCALYSCRMVEAVQILESVVREDPTAYLTEGVAFNLCTLYELGYDTAASARKKRVLQLLAKRFYLHDIGPEQFRVS